MNFLTIFFFIILWFNILTRDVGAIINGILGTQLMFNYMVSLWYMDDFICGGSILDERHILTAAHCVHNDRCPSAYTIQAGTTLWFASAVISRVSDIQVHPDFSYIDGHQLNDVAVLTLKDPLRLNYIIQKIVLPNAEDALPHCASCKIAGWGPTVFEEDIPSPGLHYADFDVLPTTDCRDHIPDIRQNEFCAKDPLNSAAPANGDSGDPLVCDGVIYGIHSDGCCNPKKPSIMVNVIEQLDFIQKAMQN